MTATIVYIAPNGNRTTGGVAIPGSPRDWVKAGLIGPTHPATRCASWYRCVRFGRTIVCESSKFLRNE